MSNLLRGGNIELQALESGWDKEYNCSITINNYEHDEISFLRIDNLWLSLQTAYAPMIIREAIELTQLGTQQRDALDAFLKLCCNPNRIQLPDESNSIPNCMLLIGYGGTGKSFTIKAIVQEIIKLNNGDGTV